jgi:hypothetical protein
MRRRSFFASRCSQCMVVFQKGRPMRAPRARHRRRRRKKHYEKRSFRSGQRIAGCGRIPIRLSVYYPLLFADGWLGEYPPNKIGRRLERLYGRKSISRFGIHRCFFGTLLVGQADSMDAARTAKNCDDSQKGINAKLNHPLAENGLASGSHRSRGAPPSKGTKSVKCIRSSFQSTPYNVLPRTHGIPVSYPLRDLI